jgi:hypothetical protein
MHIKAKDTIHKRKRTQLKNVSTSLAHTFAQLFVLKWYVTHHIIKMCHVFWNLVVRDDLIIHDTSGTRLLEAGYVVSRTDIKPAVTQSIANPLLYMRISALRATCCFFPSLPHFTTWLDRTETFSFTSLFPSEQIERYVIRGSSLVCWHVLSALTQLWNTACCLLDRWGE